MPTFITFASYSASAAKGLMQNPEDRGEAIKPLLNAIGAKLVAAYMTTGAHDIVLISEAEDGSDVAAVSLAVSGSGSLSKIETVRAWPSAEFVAIAEKAGKLTGNYSPPGA